MSNTISARFCLTIHLLCAVLADLFLAFMWHTTSVVPDGPRPSPYTILISFGGALLMFGATLLVDWKLKGKLHRALHPFYQSNWTYGLVFFGFGIVLVAYALRTFTTVVCPVGANDGGFCLPEPVLMFFLWFHLVFMGFCAYKIDQDIKKGEEKVVEKVITVAPVVQVVEKEMLVQSV